MPNIDMRWSKMIRMKPYAKKIYAKENYKNKSNKIIFRKIIFYKEYYNDCSFLLILFKR